MWWYVITVIIESIYNNQILTCKCDICGNKKHCLHVTDLDQSFVEYSDFWSSKYL